MSASKYHRHPLRLLFDNRRISEIDGMNALQEGPLHLISDNCVTVDDIAPCDVNAVIAHVNKTNKLSIQYNGISQ